MTGVVTIKKANVSNQILKKIKFIEKQEDIWFECLDVKKWDTKKIVVDKKYKKLS